jgi:catechol 2,3-dioxygenase-like lactoylglutathione lyase family enzyme
MAMVTGLAHVCVGVSDVERSLAFYRDTLGFPMAYDFHSDTGLRIGACMHLGGGTFLEFFQSNTPPTAGPAHAHFCMVTDDIEAAAADLKSRGVEVTAAKRGSDRSWNIWLADPDGNRIELQQYTPESKQRPFVE